VVDAPLARAGASLADQAVAVDTLATGTCFDRYVVLECQGRGGMGVVYAAYDPRLDRKIALKLLHHTDVEGRRRQRLLREAQALGQLVHPNVVVVFDVGSCDDRLFLTMEFVAGQTLRAWLQVPRPWRDVVRVFVEAGRGLAAAHAANVIHRDFKPENVLVGSDGRVRVADFGLARPSADVGSPEATRPGPATSLTLSGAVMGTPAYMSPEQAAGEHVDARSDQYSFCVALFEALHGRRPGGGDPSRSIAAHVPSHLRRVLDRGLRAVAAERYPAMDTLLAELARDPRAARLRAGATTIIALAGLASFGALRGREHQQPPCRDAKRKLIGVWDDATKQARRATFAATKKPFATAAWTSVERALDRGTADWVAEYTDACEATSLRGEQSAELLDLRIECLDAQRRELKAFVQLLASADGAIVQRAPQAAESVMELGPCRRTDVLRQTVRPPHGVATQVRVGALQTLLAEASALFDVGDYVEAGSRTRHVLTAARELGYSPLLAKARFRLALAEDAAGDRSAAVAGLLEATSLAETARDDHLRAQALAELVRVLARLARYDQADGYVELAEAVTRRAGDDDDLHVRLIKARTGLAKGRGRFDAALALCKQHVALRERSTASRPAEQAGAWVNLGDAYRLLGDREHAIEISKYALARTNEALGNAHPATALAANNVGAAYAENYQDAEALPYFERALAIREAALGADHADVATSAQNLGLLLGNLGQFDRARPHLERALAIKEKALGPTHPGVAMALWSLAKLHLQRRDPGAALLVARRALDIREHKLGAEHPDVAFALGLVAEAELALGRAAAALPRVERAVAIIAREKHMDLDLAELHFTLARVLWAEGHERARARTLAATARDVFTSRGEGMRKELLEVDTWLRDHGGIAR